MSTTVTMPQLGETVVEGTILKWLKAEGEEIGRDEPLFEISTDKVDTEVPSPVAGTLSKILVAEGETVSVGTNLAEIDDGTSGQQTAEVSSEPAAETEPQEEEQAEEEQEAGDKEEPKPAEEQPVGEQEMPAAAEAEAAPSGDGQAAPAPQQGQLGVEAPAAAAAAQAPATIGGGGERSHILSPLVRRLAEEHSIDLTQVTGTGTGGRITKRDITAFIDSGGAAQPPAAQPAAPAAASTGAAPAAAAVAQPAPAAPPAVQPAAPAAAPAPAAASAEPGAREEVRPLSHIRKAIAHHMVESLHNSARAWNLVEVNMEHVAQLRNRAKDAFKAAEGISLTYLPFVSRAVCDALLAYPDVNAELRGEELVYKRYVNLGIAVAYDEGLIVPVVKDADGMNVVGLARAVADLAARARSRKLKPDEVHGSTFTITNPGPFGSIISVPIINQPNTAILAFDSVEKRPVVVDDAIAIRHMVYLSMSWDHRVIDGATASQFLGRLKQNLETWDFTPELQHYLPQD
jgi:2-oxoglutarate dehydrogenase E2 component (dihydrolipoamide succinyltransferase)